jgi:crotonobetainyl-CoA:carnitine CoA-transferase CaiB-like acyl-CoA transferase
MEANDGAILRHARLGGTLNFRQLARDADVVIENCRTGAFVALGLGYEEIRKINPRVWAFKGVAGSD